VIPARGKLLLKKLETEETLPGGLVILPETVREGLTTCQMEVVALGEPDYCNDDDCERPHNDMERGGRAHQRHRALAVGAWIILAPRRLVEADEPGYYLCNQDDVLAVVQP
jgi:co-chaperonin GroES (HSP10)